MTNANAKLSLHRSSGWLSGTVGATAIARRVRLGGTARTFLPPGNYQMFRAADAQQTRGIIAILRAGERGIIIEGGLGASGTRAIIIEGGRSAGGERSIIIEGGRTTGGDRGFVVEGGLDWLNALEGGTLNVTG